MVTWIDIQTALQDFWNWLTGVGGGLTDTLGEFGSWIYGGLQWLGERIYEAWVNFTNWFYSGLQWLGDRLKEGYEALAQWISGGLQWIGSGLSWIGQQLYSFGQWVWNGIVWTARTVASAIEGFINWIWEKLIELWNTIVNYLCSWIRGINDFLNDWIKALRQKFKNLILVNTSLMGIFKSYDSIVEGNWGRGLIGLFASPIAGAIASEIIDAVIPTPSSERIIFFPEFEIPTLTHAPITIEKPEMPTTPPITEIPSEPIYPPAIGYRAIVEKTNIVTAKYEVRVTMSRTAEASCSISTEYEVEVSTGLTVEKACNVSTSYEIETVTGITIEKTCKAVTSYEIEVTIIEELFNNGDFETGDLTGWDIEIATVTNKVLSSYEIETVTGITIEKTCKMVTSYETEIITAELFNNGDFETGDLTGWTEIVSTLTVTKENYIKSEYSIEVSSPPPPTEITKECKVKSEYSVELS